MIFSPCQKIVSAGDFGPRLLNLLKFQTSQSMPEGFLYRMHFESASGSKKLQNSWRNKFSEPLHQTWDFSQKWQFLDLHYKIPIESSVQIKGEKFFENQRDL
jgi:hypothetical protein